MAQREEVLVDTNQPTAAEVVRGSMEQLREAINHSGQFLENLPPLPTTKKN